MSNAATDSEVHLREGAMSWYVVKPDLGDGRIKIHALQAVLRQL